MKTLPVEDMNGRIIGGLMLEEEYNKQLGKGLHFELGGVIKSRVGNVVGYTLAIPVDRSDDGGS